MNSSITIETFNNNEWEEISFGNTETVVTEEPAGTEPPVIHTQKIESLNTDNEIENKIRSFYKEYVKLEFEPAAFLQTDLSGEFSYFPAGLFKSRDLSERELSIIPELYKNLLYSFKITGGKKNLADMLAVYCFSNSQNVISDFIHLLEKYDMLDLSYRQFLDLSGLKPFPGTSTVENSQLVNICYRAKYGEISENEKNILFDAVISREYPGLLGLVWKLFRDIPKGERNCEPVNAMIIRRFDSFSEHDQIDFTEYYKSTRSYWQIYRLMKKNYTGTEIREWVRQERILAGRSEEHIPVDQVLYDRFDELQKENRLFSLPPFDLLILLNSVKYAVILEDIKKGIKNYPNAYVTNRAMAVYYFSHNDFERFFRYYDKSGRLKFQPEMLYFRAVALIKSGNTDAGHEILSVLQDTFRESAVLQKLTA